MSLPALSLKHLEAFYRAHDRQNRPFSFSPTAPPTPPGNSLAPSDDIVAATAVVSAQDSVVMYHAWRQLHEARVAREEKFREIPPRVSPPPLVMEEENPENLELLPCEERDLLRRIVSYNREDCLSLAECRDWLLSLRTTSTTSTDPTINIKRGDETSQTSSGSALSAASPPQPELALARKHACPAIFGGVGERIWVGLKGDSMDSGMPTLQVRNFYFFSLPVLHISKKTNLNTNKNKSRAKDLRRSLVEPPQPAKPTDEAQVQVIAC